jgi:hypothetical protein
MTTEDAQLFVAKWAFAAPALERARQQEIAAFSHEEQASKIDELLAAGLLHASPRFTSGLVEMQRILARARR